MPTVLLLRAALVVSFGLSLGLAPRMALAAGNTYSEAPVITKSQFLHELKEVAVTFAFDPWLAKYISEAEQQAYVTKALARYNIAVRSNAPVSLLVTLDHVPTTIRETTTFFRRPDQITIYQDHNFYYSMGFFVRAAALRDGKLHPVQQAFLEHGGLQCGYCTPGMILSACALLDREPKASRAAIVKGMEGNLCRCGAHQRIVAAIESLSGAGKGAS